MADKPIIVDTPAFSSPDPATEAGGQSIEVTDQPGMQGEIEEGTLDYESMTRDDLESLVGDRALELPDSGSGKDGAFVKQDFIDVLEEADATNAE